jgi:hypothetical protein
MIGGTPLPRVKNFFTFRAATGWERHTHIRNLSDIFFALTINEVAAPQWFLRKMEIAK